MYNKWQGEKSNRIIYKGRQLLPLFESIGSLPSPEIIKYSRFKLSVTFNLIKIFIDYRIKED